MGSGEAGPLVLRGDYFGRGGVFSSPEVGPSPTQTRGKMLSPFCLESLDIPGNVCGECWRRFLANGSPFQLDHCFSLPLSVGSSLCSAWWLLNCKIYGGLRKVLGHVTLYQWPSNPRNKYVEAFVQPPCLLLGTTRSLIPGILTNQFQVAFEAHPDATRCDRRCVGREQRRLLEVVEDSCWSVFG